MMCFLFILPVFSGFAINMFSTHPKLPQLKCPKLVDLSTQKEINLQCPLLLDNFTFPIVPDLNQKQLRNLHPPRFTPSNSVKDTLTFKLVWSGPTTLNSPEFCFEREECRFNVRWSATQGWSAVFFKVWNPTAKDLDPADPFRIQRNYTHGLNLSIGFFGPVKATLSVNHVLFRASWINETPYYQWCIFCSPEYKSAYFPVSHKNVPMGVLSIQLNYLPGMIPLLDEGFIGLSYNSLLQQINP
ncbi:hypothetical protein DSO57_1035633 [Entomophthora muscae]|uniref:Uncharacterized protein n=1 Tax=Entomophthora muscae TaxID=34485 RepID=A0ACC2RE70_9FUNG|nr:hypothetical protein DSO57_1035633 [Entomophthora muscae]